MRSISAFLLNENAATAVDFVRNQLRGRRENQALYSPAAYCADTVGDLHIIRQCHLAGGTSLATLSSDGNSVLAPNASDAESAMGPKSPGAKGIRPLLIAGAVSVAGDGALVTAAPLLATTLTKNPTAVASVTAAVYIPWLIFGLAGGVLADRWSRRRVMIAADVFRAVVLALLCALIITGKATVAALVIAIVLIGIAQCLFDPASHGIIPTIVGRNKGSLDRVNGRFAAVDIASRSMVGPLLGVWIFSIHRVLPFFADAVSFIFSAFFVSRLPKTPPATDRPEPILTAVRTGFVQLFQSGELHILALAMLVSNFGYNLVISTFVIYTRDVLHIGPRAYGALFAVLAIGGVIAGWVGSRFIQRISARRVQAFGSITWGLVWLLIALFANSWITAMLLFCVGATASLNSMALSTASQRLAPDGSLSRITAIFRVSSLGGGSIGALVGGVIAAHFGLIAPFIVAGILQIIFAIILWNSVHFGRMRIAQPS